ncbi:MAG: hypothetical protein AAF492_32090, partial [Verrucomicrobiota bacterium]
TAPRPLRVIQATEDPLYHHPQPVADAMKKIYAAVGHPDRFSYVALPGGHGYTPEVIAREQAWLIQWLNPETPDLPGSPSFAANRALLNNPKNLQCFTGSRKGWTLNGRPIVARSAEAVFTPKTPVPEIPDRAAFDAFRKQALQTLREDVLTYASSDIPVVVEKDTLLIDGSLKRPYRYLPASSSSDRTMVLLADQLTSFEPLPNMNLFAVEATRLKDRHLRRYAALVGHTAMSLNVNDTLAALHAIRQTSSIPSSSVILKGTGKNAVAALYAAALDRTVDEIVLEDCPGRFDGDTALLGILRHLDLPASAALLFPRPIRMTGKVDPVFQWTAGMVSGSGGGSRRMCMRSKI